MVHLMKLFYYPIESNWWLLNNTGCNITPHLYNVHIYTHMYSKISPFTSTNPHPHSLYQLTLNYSVYLHTEISSHTYTLSSYTLKYHLYTHPHTLSILLSATVYTSYLHTEISSHTYTLSSYSLKYHHTHTHSPPTHWNIITHIHTLLLHTEISSHTYTLSSLQGGHKNHQLNHLWDVDEYK